MVYVGSVLYKASPNFNLDYYKTKHLDLLVSLAKGAGLKSVQVVTLNPETSQGYAVQAFLTWESKEAMLASFTKDGDKLKADIKNFSDVEPVTLTGEVVVSVDV